jgi:tetratricopeptide (TPR) repeat protein
MRGLVILFLLTSVSAMAQDSAGPADSLWTLYKEGRFEEVATQGKALLNTGNETPQINLAVGRALADLDRTEEAMPYLVRASRGDPGQGWVYAWGQVYLGRCQARLGNLEQAARAWKLARDCGATVNATRTASGNLMLLGLDEFYDDWTEVETAHLNLRFSPRLAVFDREGFARTREESYSAINTWFGGGPARKVRFFVWADPAEAKMAGLPDLGFSRPEDYLIHSLSNQTRGHELAHVIGHHARHPVVKTGLINEGISVALDQTGRDTMERARQAVGAGDPESSAWPRVALRALWQDFDLLTDDQSYPIAGAFVDWLLKRGGKEHFLVFFEDQSYINARAVYGEPLELWIDEFETRLHAEN